MKKYLFFVTLLVFNSCVSVRLEPIMDSSYIILQSNDVDIYIKKSDLNSYVDKQNKILQLGNGISTTILNTTNNCIIPIRNSQLSFNDVDGLIVVSLLDECFAKLVSERELFVYDNKKKKWSSKWKFKKNKCIIAGEVHEWYDFYINGDILVFSIITSV